MPTGTAWLDQLKLAKKTALVQDGKRKIHYVLKNETELVEEYDNRTHVLISRRWRRKTRLGGDGEWEIEVGDCVPSSPNILDELAESNTNPRFTRLDTAKAFQWRVRNMPYPLDNYSVSVVNPDSDCLELKTQNKKYYKRFAISDLQRLNIPLTSDSISLSHANNTLVISYEKPKEFVEFENELRNHLASVKPLDEQPGDCKTS